MLRCCCCSCCCCCCCCCSQALRSRRPKRCRSSRRHFPSMVRYGTVQYGTVRCGAVWYGIVWYDTVRYGTVQYGMKNMIDKYIYIYIYVNAKTIILYCIIHIFPFYTYMYACWILFCPEPSPLAEALPEAALLELAVAGDPFWKVVSSSVSGEVSTSSLPQCFRQRSVHRSSSHSRPASSRVISSNSSHGDDTSVQVGT